MDSRLDSVYACQIRRFHFPLWCQWRKNGVSDEALSQSLERLYALGYGDSEVAVMFGVSRERVRQWRERFGITRPAQGSRGTRARIWDDRRRCFCALSPIQAECLGRVRRHERESRERRRRLEMIRELSIRCLHLLKERQHAVPTRCEIAGELGITMSLLTAAWREPSDRTPHRDAFRRLYAAAGVRDSGRYRARIAHLFSRATIKSIRQAHALGRKTITEIAWHYRVSYACIWRILRGGIATAPDRETTALEADWMPAGALPGRHGPSMGEPAVEALMAESAGPV